jgi:hypothetical protein
MHSIANIGSRSPPISQSSGINAMSGQFGTGFQLASLSSSSQPAARGIYSTATPSLGAQTVSTLLQTQDMSQTQARGGHGGGGEHHGMKMMSGLEVDEAGEGEEGQLLSLRKKAEKKTKSVSVFSVNKTDEDELSTDNCDQTEEGNPDKAALNG